MPPETEHRHPITNAKLHEDVTVLYTRVEGLENAVSSISSDVKALVSGMNELRQLQIASRNPNWQTWIAGFAIMIAVVGGAYGIISGMLFQPLNRSVEANQTAIANIVTLDNSRQAQIYEVQTLVTQIQEKLKEVETQFRGSDECRNIQFANQQRMNALIYNKAFKDAGLVYPDSPYYFPHISTREPDDQ